MEIQKEYCTLWCSTEKYEKEYPIDSSFFLTMPVTDKGKKEKKDSLKNILWVALGKVKKKIVSDLLFGVVSL